MQEEKTDAQNQSNIDAALEAAKKLQSCSEEEFIELSHIIGEALMLEQEQIEKETKVKMPDIKGLQAAKAFEDFIKDHFEDVKQFSKSYDWLGERISYDVIVPRIMVDDYPTKGLVKRFSQILEEAVDLDIGIETENPDYVGMIYLDVMFPAIIRTK